MTEPDEPTVTDSPTKRHGDALEDVVQDAPEATAPAEGEDEHRVPPED